jgi:peptidoglycan/LPS O-acetylase OafA/YrhL
VQGLRAIAVGLVVLNHAGVGLVAGGYVGVDIFFVISGFLITGLLLKDASRGSIGFSTFYSRRARRILPAATLVIVATCLVSVHIMNFVLAKEVVSDAVWASFFAANVKFGHSGTDYFNHNAASPLEHFWSLAVEEQFYLIWPALLALTLFAVPALLRRSRHARRARSERGVRMASSEPVERLPAGVATRRVTLVLVALGAISLYLSIHQTARTSTAAYFSTFDRAWELVAGALLATCLPLLDRIPPVARALLGWFGLIGIVVAALTFNANTPFPGSAALLPVLSTCALIAAGVGSPRGASVLIAKRPMRFVGDISYSLYLWHWPVLILGAAYIGHASNAWQTIGLVALAFALSVLSYRLVEDPLRKSTRLWARKPRRALILWPVAFASVLVMSVAVRPAPSTGGADFATSPSFRNLTVEGQVELSVIAANRAMPIPADVTPSFGAIRQDFKSIGDCSGYLKASNRICQFGDSTATKRAVLFGNSHATMWLPVLSPIMKQDAHWQLFPLVKEACNYPEFLGAVPVSKCGVWYRWAIEQIRTLHPDVIIMGGDYDGTGWQQAVAAAIADMKGQAPRVIFIRLAPGLHRAPFDCLLQRHATLHDCLFAEPEKSLQRDSQEAAIVDAAKIDDLRTRQWFCYQRFCPSVIGSLIPYADTGHVTATYARHLRSELERSLRMT